jgi:hypothetical protein
VAQLVEHVLNEFKVLSSNPGTVNFFSLSFNYFQESYKKKIHLCFMENINIGILSYLKFQIISRLHVFEKVK